MKYNFYTDLFEKNSIPDVYVSINQKKTTSLKIINTLNHKIKSFELVPNYLVINTKKNLINNKIFQKKGYAINLDSSANVEHYIKSQLNKSARKNFIRSLNRLESCFNIKYKVFYGHITNEDYQYYMEVFYKMLHTRFQQRNDRNLVLENWNYYLETIFDLLNKKKASFFLITNNSGVIAFSINYHFDNICYSSIASFDSNYYKFSLGNTIIYKLSEWCIVNNLKTLDLGYGDFTHKRLWCNTTYAFENHIVYSPNNYIAIAYAIYIKNKYKVINYLISKNINVFYNKIKSFFIGKKMQDAKSLIFNIETTQLSFFDFNNLIIVDFNQDQYSFLKKTIYDFLYTKQEHISDVSAYKTQEKPSVFFIKGKLNHIKIEIVN